MDTVQMEAFRRAHETSAKRPAPPSARLDQLTDRIRPEQHETLARWAESDDARRRNRSKIVLLSAQGVGPDEVGRQLGVAVPTVYKWLRRFARQGIPGLSDLPRSGQPHRLSKEKRAEILRVTRDDLPPKGGRWTIRVAARHLGVTQHQVRQVWADAGLKPHELPLEARETAREHIEA